MIHEGGILSFKENNEPYFTRNFDEANQLRKTSPYQIKKQMKKESLKLRMGLIFKNVGLDWHTVIKGRQYRKKLSKALSEKGLLPQ
jgi:hypothetical protein